MTKRLLLAALICIQLQAGGNDIDSLLLTPRRIKRLKMDADRETERWLAFENRFTAAIDSPERGLEYAVQYVLTGETTFGHAAIDWTATHPCHALELALVKSALGNLETAKLDALHCSDDRQPLARFTGSFVGDAFLLALTPPQVEHPTWEQHVGALLLVNKDPNSQSSQFLQGWALEDRFTLRGGPGVVFEFLYANPYLPGVSYQNRMPWFYETGELYLRTDWTADACWIHLAASVNQSLNCKPGLFSSPFSLPGLLVIPATDKCTDIPEHRLGATILMANFPPGQRLTYTTSDQKEPYQADAIGFWRVPVGEPGKVCRTR